MKNIFFYMHSPFAWDAYIKLEVLNGEDEEIHAQCASLISQSLLHWSAILISIQELLAVANVEIRFNGEEFQRIIEQYKKFNNLSKEGTHH